MSNEEFQWLLRVPANEVRERIVGKGQGGRAIQRVLSELDDDEIGKLVRDLGGHDLLDLLDAFDEADRVTDRPSVIFAYTIKAWGLPTQGHPANHSALLSPAQWSELATSLGADVDEPWARFPDASPEATFCAQAADRLERPELTSCSVPEVPYEVGRSHSGLVSTQQAMGRFFLDLDRESPEVARRIVTVSPDVASSTNLGGWINRVGVWNTRETTNWFADDMATLIRWNESGRGQHIELGIAEGNLVGLLGELGATWSRDGQPLLPIGTLYDPFVNRGTRGVVVRHLRGRTEHSRGNAFWGHACSRRRGASVDYYPLRRA